MDIQTGVVPLYGQIGSVEESGDKVQCHICGKWFRNLGLHINRGHKMECDDYREAFGLARSYALCSSAFSAQQNKIHGARIAALGSKGRAKLKALTSEELAAQAKIKRRKSTHIKNSENRKKENSVQRLMAVEVRAKANEKRRETAVGTEYREKMSRIVNAWYADPKNAQTLANKQNKLKVSCNAPSYLLRLSERVRIWHSRKISNDK